MDNKNEEPIFEWDLPKCDSCSGDENLPYLSEDMKQRLVETHKKHCSVNWCKYGDDDCPVVMGDVIKDGIPEVKYDTPQERIWNVEVCRTSYAFKKIQVIALTEQEAIGKAIAKAGNETFSEKESDYSAPDGAY